MLCKICSAITKAMINWNAWWMQETARLCHRLGFVSVLTHGPQLDIDVLKICNASVRLVHHNCHNYHTKVTKYVLLVIYINYTDLIRLLKVPIIFFLFYFIFNLPMCTPWRDSVYAVTPLSTLWRFTEWELIHLSIVILMRLVMGFISFTHNGNRGPSWSYGSCIYNYICNQSISTLKLWVRNMLMAKCIRYNIM